MTDVRIHELPALASSLISGNERFAVDKQASSWSAYHLTLNQVADYVPFRLNFSPAALSLLQNLIATASELNALSGISPSLTATQLNRLAGVSPGISQADKVAVLGSSRNLDYLNLTTLALGGTAIQSSAAELNMLHAVPNGLTKQDLGMLPLLLRLFVNVFDVTLSFPDFSTVSVGSDFDVLISNVRTFRGDICQGAALEFYVNNHSSYVVTATVGSSGSATVTMRRGSTNTSSQAVINAGANTYHLKITFRGVSLMTTGNFDGSGSSSPPLLET